MTAPRRLRPRARLIGAALADPGVAPGLYAEVLFMLRASRTQPAAALLLGVATRTLQAWVARYPELRAALEAGRAEHGLDRRGYPARSVTPQQEP